MKNEAFSASENSKSLERLNNLCGDRIKPLRESDKRSEIATRRELAAMAMQGMLANSSYCVLKRFKLSEIAEDAIVAADALLAELDKTPK